VQATNGVQKEELGPTPQKNKKTKNKKQKKRGPVFGR
jgi:hypothetical protein